MILLKGKNQAKRKKALHELSSFEKYLNFTIFISTILYLQSTLMIKWLDKFYHFL